MGTPPSVIGALLVVALGWPFLPTYGVVLAAGAIGTFGLVFAVRRRPNPVLESLAYGLSEKILSRRRYTVFPPIDSKDPKNLEIEFTPRAAEYFRTHDISFDLATGDVCRGPIPEGPSNDFRRWRYTTPSLRSAKPEAPLPGWHIFDPYVGQGAVPRGLVTIDVGRYLVEDSPGLKIIWSWVDRHVSYDVAVREFSSVQAWLDLETGRTGVRSTPRDHPPWDGQKNPLDKTTERDGVTFRADTDELLKKAQELFDRKTAAAQARWDWETQKPGLRDRHRVCSALLGEILDLHGVLRRLDGCPADDRESQRAWLVAQTRFDTDVWRTVSAFDSARWKDKLEARLNEVQMQTRARLSESQPERWSINDPVGALMLEMQILRHAWAHVELVVVPKENHMTQLPQMEKVDEERQKSLRGALAANVLSQDGRTMFIFFPEQDLEGSQEIGGHEIDHLVENRLPPNERKRIAEIHERQLQNGELPSIYSGRINEGWTTKIEMFDDQIKVKRTRGSKWLAEHDPEIYALATLVYGQDPASKTHGR